MKWNWDQAFMTFSILTMVGWHQGLSQQGIIQEGELPYDSVSFSVTVSPVTVHASLLETPFTVSSRDQIRIGQIASPTIEPLLNATPGIFMQSGALNTNRISIRGVGYREPFATTGIKVYLDEIPLTNGAGEASIEDIHPYLFSGIDIWRGPASALWGSGLGGMIHLKSVVPERDILKTSVQFGSFERFQLDQLMTFRYGKQEEWGTLLHCQYLHDGSYRDNNDYKKYSATWLQHWKNKHGWSVRSFIHGIDLLAFIPSSLTRADYDFNPSAAAPTWAAIRGYEDYKKWISGLNLLYTPQSGWVYRGSFFGTFFDSDEVRPFNVLKESNTSYGTRHRMTWKAGKSAHITTGFEYYGERYAFSTFETLSGGRPGQKLSDQTEQRSYLNGFMQSDVYLSTRWFAFAGLSSSWSKFSDSSHLAKIPFDVFPSIGMSFISARKFSITASLSRGYSALALSTLLNADGTIHPGIKPETGWSGELSFKSDFGHQGYVRLNLFMLHMKNTIITRRIMDDVFEKINGGSTLHRGMEIEFKWNTLSRTLSIDGALTIGDYLFDEFNDRGEDRSGNKLPGVPQDMLFMRIRWAPWSGLSLYLEVQSRSDVWLNDANTSRGDGYQLLGSGILLSIMKKEKWEINVSAHGHNLLDTHYASMFQINAPGDMPRYFYPGKPRSFYFNIAVQHALD